MSAPAMLRADLIWSTDAATGEHVLHDPISGAEFTVAARQREILLSNTLGDFAELCASLTRLCLLASDTAPSEIIAKQRDERRRLVTHVQREKFDAQLKSVRANIPFYRSWFSELDEGCTLEHLQKLPLLTKADLRAAASDPLALVPIGRARETAPVMELTTGTTAERFHIATEPGYKSRIVDKVLGQNRRVREAFKRRPDLRMCSIASPLFDDHETPIGATGRSRSFTERLRGRDLRFDTPGNIFTLPVEKLDQMLEEACAFDPGAMIGDPVYLSALACHARSKRARLPRLELIVASFELVSEVSRRIIESVFGCPVYDVYSATEFGAPVVECDQGQYHVCEDSFVVELLLDGRPVEPGGVGRIVVTTLDKQYTPMLRYDSGDLARAASAPCSCPFSHNLSIASLEGRACDMVTDQSGALITTRMVDRAVARASGFSFYELVQQADGCYLLNLIPDETFSDQTIRALDGELHALFGRGATIVIEPVEVLEPAPSGKFRLTRRHLSLTRENMA